MIKTDGTIEFESPQAIITPSTTRDDFLAMPLAKISRALNQNTPWSRYGLGTVMLHHELFAAQICFCRGRLHEMNLSSQRPEFDGFWKGNNDALHLFHKRFLEKIFDPVAHSRTPEDPTAEMGYHFSWGGAYAAIDVKSDHPFIRINYVGED